MSPNTTRQWIVQGREGFDSLKFNETAHVPKLGEKDVLVRFHYASLNYRDLIIPKVSFSLKTAQILPLDADAPDHRANILPAERKPTGARLRWCWRSRSRWFRRRFKKGDKVLTLFNQGHIADPLTPEIIASGVGGMVDGTLAEYGRFDEQWLVSMPESLSFQEASTLPCAALTAWDALYGLESTALKPGDTVLTQGTGGVSIWCTGL